MPARAGPPFLPRAIAASLFPSFASEICPVAISTISLPSWMGSRGTGEMLCRHAKKSRTLRSILIERFSAFG